MVVVMMVAVLEVVVVTLGDMWSIASRWSRVALGCVLHAVTCCNRRSVVV